MGNKEVVIEGTHGLWKLIMMKKPDVYLDEDLENYKELLDRTNAILYPHHTTEGGKPETTAKWRFLDGLDLIPEVQTFK